MRTACTIATFAVSTSLLVAPLAPVAAQQNAPAAQKDALVAHSAGIDAILVDPKDAGLLRALKMLDERVLELPREVEDESMPAPAIQLALQLLMSPMSLRAGVLDMNAGGEPPNGPPFYGQINFYGSPDVAADFAGRFTGMLAQAGAPPVEPAPDMPGMKSVDADGVPLYFGTMKAADGAAFVIGVNKVGTADVAVAAPGLPKDVKPAIFVRLDSRELQPLIEMALSHAGEGPEAEMARAQLAMTGMYGPNAGEIIGAVGHGKDRCHGWGTFTNYRKLLAELGMQPEGALTANDLKRVPADATYAQVGKMNLAGMMKMLADMGGEAMRQQGADEDAAADPFKMVEDAIGVHPQRDLADHLGQTMGSYMSDSTGGGGLASLVAFIEVKNPDGLNQTMARLRGTINQIAQDEAKGYIRIGETNLGDQKVMTLLFPGLPIPLEVCWTIADGWLYAAGSPNALRAAIDQGRSGANSLNDNPRFKEMGGSDLTDAMQVTFIDTPRMLGAGYGLMSMGMSALANAVRSPTDLQRDAGIVMPSFAALSKDAKANVTVARLTGDDLVITSQADRSMLVNACGMAGAMGGMTGVVAAAALAGGVMLPALSQARQSAKDVKSMSQLRMIGMAYNMHAADNADKLPTSTDDLVGPGYIAEDAIVSPMGEAMDEQGSIWLNLKGGKLSAISDPSQYVIGYDRAMFFTGDTVAVVFLDGHCEQLDIEAFRELTQSEAHDGIDFKLPY